MKKIRLFGLLMLVLVLCLSLTACKKATLTGITLNTDNVQKEFAVGDEFTHDGLVVTANYSDDSSQAVTDYSVSTPDMTSAGNKTVTVTYQGMTADYQITVSDVTVIPDPEHVLNSISINTDNVLKTFAIGDTFSYDGLVVTGHFETEPLTEVITKGYTVSTPDMSTSGDKTVTVTYLGKTATYTINVAPRTLQEISVDVTNVKTVFTQGDEFTYEGLVVTAHYNGEPRTETVTDYDVNEDEIDMSVAGQKTVIISYQGKTASYEIIVNEKGPEVKGISVNASGAMTVFAVGSEFNYEGIVVRAGYEGSNTFTVVTDYTVTAPDMSTPGTKTVTVTYQGKTATYEIVVTDAALEKLEVNASKATKEYFVGDTFSADGIEVTASYADGNTTIVRGYIVSEPDMTTAGDKTITVTYQDKSAEYTITVAEKSAEAQGNYNGEALILEGENATREGSNDLQGANWASGGWFIGNIANDSKITFTFNSSVTGTVELYLAISHGNSGITRAFDVYVNGEKECEFDAQNSGGWQNMKEFLVCKVEIEAGLNIVEFHAINTNNLVNIDYLKVAPEGSGSGGDSNIGGNVIGAGSATVQGGCDIQSNGSGADGHIVGGIGAGCSISFTVISDGDASVNMHVFLSGGAGYGEWGWATTQMQAFEIYVNGQSVGVFDFDDNRGYVDWREYVVSDLSLNDGENTIEIRFLQGNANFSHLVISPVE